MSRVLLPDTSAEPASAYGGAYAFEISTRDSTETEPRDPNMRDQAPEWLEAAIAQLNHLHTLDEGWDGYGARAVNSSTIAAAKAVLRALSMVEYVMKPSVTASSDGNAAFTWGNDTFTLDVEFLPGGFAEYTYIDHADESHDHGATIRWDNCEDSLLSILADVG